MIGARPLSPEVWQPGSPESDAWLALAPTHPFAHPAVVGAWARAAPGGATPLPLGLWRDGILVGVVPLMTARVRRGPAGVPRHDVAPDDRAFLGPGSPRPFRLRQIAGATSLAAAMTVPQPICRSGDEAAVAEAAARWIAARRGWEVLVLFVDAATSGPVWMHALGAARLDPRCDALGRRIGSIATPQPAEALLRRHGYKPAQNLRRARAAAATAGLAIDVHRGAEAVRAKLPALASVAARSWKQPGVAGELAIPYAGPQQRFVEALLARPDAPEPILVTVGGEAGPVAALLGYRTGSTWLTHLTFRTPDHPSTGTGQLAMARLIDLASAEGATAIDLNATHPWTRHLHDTTREEVRVSCFAPTWRGQGMAAVARWSGRR